MSVCACDQTHGSYTHACHTYIYTLIHIHTWIHTYIHIHTCMHTYIHTRTHTHPYMHTRIHTHPYMHTHIHPYTHSHIPPCILLCQHVPPSPSTRARLLHQAVVDPTVLEDKAMCKVGGGGEAFQPCSHMPSRSPFTVT